MAGNRILALDIGASKVVLAEFLLQKGGAPELLNYGIVKLGMEPDKDTESSAYIVSAIRDVMKQKGIKPAPLQMSVSGQMVFPRYVKLPPVTHDKLLQIINYEAEQNVPFPIEEVVWDYQLIGDTGTGELNVMLVAVKIENITAITDCVQAAGLEPEIVDVAPMALYNAVRFNYPDLADCTMILDVGARSSNLVFVEGNRIFSRSIPVAGNAVTQELMKEFELSFKDAEELKLAHAFVAFGGVYAGPDSEVADRVSKIVRNVITRLHAEVNRSINFYRSQQGGSPPSMILLTGGTSIMPHLDTFFREKLSVEVEYLNPFENVTVSAALDPNQLGEDLHLLSEVTGVALRKSLTCPVEIDLMPPSLVAKKKMRKRLPFFAATALALILTALCWWVYVDRTQDTFDARVKSVEGKITELTAKSDRLRAVTRKKSDAQLKADTVGTILTMRTQWIRILDSVRKCLLDGMWITAVHPVVEDDGQINAVEISVSGWTDKLKKQTEGKSMNALELCRENLRTSEFFTEKSDFKNAPVTTPATQSFAITANLKKPIRARPK